MVRGVRLVSSRVLTLHKTKLTKMNFSFDLPANKVNSAILAAIRVLNLVLSSRETDGLDRLPSGQIVFLQPACNEMKQKNPKK